MPARAASGVNGAVDLRQVVVEGQRADLAGLVLDDGDFLLAVEQADRLDMGNARHLLQVVGEGHQILFASSAALPT
jgi:hypothetical protein